MKKTITLMLGIYLSVNLLLAQNLITNPGFENDPTTYTVVESSKNVLMRVAAIQDATTQIANPTSSAVDISAGGIWVKKSVSSGYVKVKVIDTDTHSGTYAANLHITNGGTVSNYQYWYGAINLQEIVGGLSNTKKYVASVWAKKDETAGNVIDKITFFVTDNTLKQNITTQVTLTGGTTWTKYDVSFDIPTFVAGHPTANFSTAFFGIGITTTLDGSNLTNYSGVLLDDYSLMEDTTTALANVYLKGNPIISQSKIISTTLAGKLDVYNVAGSIVLTKYIQSGEDVNLSSGVYFLQLTTKDGIYNQKVVL